MEFLLTTSEMKEYDQYAIKKLCVPSIILMENAGLGVVSTIERLYGDFRGKTCIIFCGKGNNGGDGFVVARHLINRGADVFVVLIGNPKDVKGDAEVNYKIFMRLIKEKNLFTNSRFIRYRSPQTLKRLPKAFCIIDAIFGTGFSGNVKKPYSDVIEWINSAQGIKVSIDIPSGINADNGRVSTNTVRAEVTITMGLKKIGLVIGEARKYVGQLHVVDIGVPQHLTVLGKCKNFLLTSHDVRLNLPKRPMDAHKYSVGKVFVLAGSRGFTGAAAMASESALRSGAGAVILGTPRSVYPILAKKLTEVMVNQLEETSNGSIALSALPKVREYLRWCDLLLLGPGLSRDDDTQRIVWRILNEFEKPILIDADGLNALSENISILRKRKSKSIILTPHSGEFSRLTKISVQEIESNRIEISRKFAMKYKVFLVLKGAPSIIAVPDGMVYVNSTGNPGMATAGSGDVLAGIIAGLWAQKMKTEIAAYCGVYLHGRAGDIALQNLGEKSLLATDILHYLPEAIQSLEV